jgi:hypothetical protein
MPPLPVDGTMLQSFSACKRTFKMSETGSVSEWQKFFASGQSCLDDFVIELRLGS